MAQTPTNNNPLDFSDVFTKPATVTNNNPLDFSDVFSTDTPTDSGDESSSIDDNMSFIRSQARKHEDENPPVEPDFTGPIKDYFYTTSLTDYEKEYQDPMKMKILSDLAQKKVDFFKDRSVPYVDKVAEATKMQKELQKKKDITAFTDMQSAAAKLSGYKTREPDYFDKLAEEWFPTTPDGSYSHSVTKSIDAQKINKLQAELGSGGFGGILSLITNLEGENAKKAIENPSALTGMTREQIKENAGLTGVRVRSLGAVDSEGNSDVKYKELAYSEPITYTSNFDRAGNEHVHQTGGMNPLERKGYQRDGIYQDIGTLADHIKGKQGEFQEIVAEYNRLIQDFNKAPSLEAEDALNAYNINVYKPASDYINKQIANVKLLEDVARNDFGDLTAAEKERADRNQLYIKAIEQANKNYESGFIKGTAKSLTDGSFLELYAPVPKNIYNFTAAAVWGIGDLASTPLEAFDYMAHGNVDNYKADRYTSESRFREEIFALPDRYRNPELFERDAQGNLLLDKINWVEAGPLAAYTTLQSLEIAGVTALSGAALTELGLFGTEAGALTNAMKASVLPVTASMTYGDFLYNNMESGLNANQAKTLALFQSMVEGFTERLSPLEAKIFNPEYWATHSLTYQTRRGVLRTLFRDLTGKELSETAERTLLQSSKDLFGKFSKDTAINFGVSAAKGTAQGAYIIAQETAEEVAAELLNSPINRVADQYIAGYQYEPLSTDQLLYTTISSAISMLPTGLFGAGSTMLHKQIPSYRLEVARNANMFQEMLDHDFVANKISKAQYDQGSKEIQLIKTLASGNEMVLNNLDDKTEQADFINTLVGREKFSSAVTNQEAADRLGRAVSSAAGIAYAPFLTKIPEYITDNKGNKVLNKEQLTNAELYAVELEKFNDHLETYVKKAYDNLSLPKEERQARQEEKLIKATKEKFTDDFIEDLYDIRQVRFHQQNLLGRMFYMPTEKVKGLVNGINTKLEAKLAELESAKAVEETKVDLDLTPKTETVVVNGKDYIVTYNEDFSTQEFKNPDGTLVENEDERQAIQDFLYKKVDDALEARRKGAAAPKAPTSIKLKTSRGVREYQIGKPYFVGKLTTEDADGHKLVRFAEITILGENPDGTIRIQGADKKPRDISPEVLADYKLGSVEAIGKSKTAKFYFNNANIVFEFKFGKGVKRTGRIEYDSDKNELLFVYRDKNGKIQQRELTEKDLVAQKGYSEARLEPKEDENGKPIDLAKKEKIRKEREEAAQASFAESRARMRDRRSAIVQDFVEKYQKIVDKVKVKISNLEARLEKNEKDMETVQKDLAFYWKKRDEGFKGVSKTKISEKIAALLEFGRNLENEKAELEEDFTELQEKLNKAVIDLTAAEDIAEDLDTEFEDTTIGLSGILEGTLRSYKSILKEAKNFVKNGQSMIQKITDAIDAIKKVVFGIIDSVEKKYPGLTDLSKESAEDYIDSEVTGKTRSKVKLEKARLKAQLAHLDQEVEEIDSQEKALNDLQKRIELAKKEVVEFAPKVKLLTKLLKEVKAREAEYNSEVNKRKRESAKKTLGMESKAASDKASDVSTGIPAEDQDLVPASEAQKALDILFNSTVTPDQLSDPSVLRLVNTLNNLASPVVKDGKITAASHLKPYHKLLLVTKANAPQYGLESIIFNDSHIVAVLVADFADGVKFVGEDLEILASPTADNVVFASLPEPELVWSKGQYEGQPRYFDSLNTPDTVKDTMVAAYEGERTTIHQELAATPDKRILFPITSVSEGFTIKSDPAVNNPVQGHLITQEAFDAAIEEGKPLIVIPTVRDATNPKVGAVSAGARTVNMPIGRPLLKIGSAVRFLNNRKLTNKEKATIKDLLQLFVIRAVKNLESRKEGEEGNILDPVILDYLQKILYWKIPAEGASMARNQIYLETYGGEARFILGENRVEVPFTIEDIQSSINLDTFLDEVYNNVDVGLLNALSPVEGKTTKVASFLEITEVDLEKDEITGRKWDTYQEYLLSNKNPDGTARDTADIPLTTNVDPISDKTPNIKGRYFIFNKEESSAPEPTIATENKNPDAKTIVYKDTVYEEVKTNVNSFDLVTLLRENNPDHIYITTLLNGITLKYQTTSGAPTVAVVELPAGATKTLEEINKSLNDFLQDDAKIADAISSIAGAKFSPSDSRSRTTVFKKTSEKVDTTQTNTPTQSTTTVDDAKKKAKDRKKRLNDSMDSNTRLVTRNKFYETEDFKAFKEWFESNFPNTISVERLPNVIDGIAQGQFKNNAIRIYQFAEIGTGYHEAFEAVWNAFLSPIEREALLNEFKRREGSFTEYNTGNKIAYSKATISQAKEQMAEEFRTFKLTGKKFEGATKQNSWFRRLLNFLRDVIFGKPATITEIQDRMSSAYYKTKSLKRSARLPLFRSSQNYRTFNPDDLHSIKFFAEVMDGMTAFMFARLTRTSGSIPAILRGSRQLNTIYHDIRFDLQKHYIGQGDFYQKFFPLYRAGDYQGIIDLIEAAPIEETSAIVNQLFDFYNTDVLAASNQQDLDSALSELKESLDDYVNQWEKVNNDYAAFVTDHKEHLEQYNLVFDENDDVTEEEKFTNEYARDVLALSSKDNSSAAIKLLVGSLVEKRIRPNGKIVDVRSEVSGLPKLVDYGQTWAVLLNELSGTRNINEQIERLRELVPIHPEFEKLVERLGVFSENMSSDQMNLRVQFEGIFHKVRPDYFRFVYTTETDDTGLLSSYKLYRLNSSLENEVERVKNDWVSSMRDKSFIVTDENGNKVINVDKLSQFQVAVNDFKTNKRWLEYLGWDFDAPLTDAQIETFNANVSALRNSFLREENSILVDRRTFAGRLRSLALLYVKASSKTTDTQHFNIEGKPQQNTILDNFVSIHLKDFNAAKSLDDFLNTVPAFKNSAFSKGSQLLKKGGLFFTKSGARRGNTLTLGIAEGIKREQDTEGTHTSALTYTARLITEFNHNLHGSYYVFVPADIKTEYPLNFGYFFDINDIKDTKVLEDKIWSIYSEYLLDEINVIQDYNTKGIGSEFVSFNEKYTSSDKLTKGQQLQLFKDILTEKQVDKITTFANNSTTREEGRVFIEKNRPALLKDIRDHITEVASQTYNDFESRGLIGYNAKGYMQFYGADNEKLLDVFDKAATFTERDMMDVFTLRTLNYMTANVEQFKFMFSDPIFWKDPLKRTKSFVGSREHTVNGLDSSNEFNAWARTNLNTLLSLDGSINLKAPVLVDDKISLESRGYMNFDGTFQKITLSDVTLVSEMYRELHNEKIEQYAKEVGATSYEELTPSQKSEVDKLVSIDPDLQTYSPFADINEADAQGGITISAFRELLWRAGKWTDEQEIMYQYEMSYERQALSKTDKYTYTDEALKAYDEKVLEAGDPSEKWDKDQLNRARFQVLKPLKAGYSINSNVLAPSLDKYSLSPMYYRLLEKSENGLSMYNQMADQGVHYFIFESGNKVGGLTTKPGTTGYHKVYTNQGKVVEQQFVREANDYKYIGIQVETPAKDKTTRGTQISKQVLSNLFNGSIFNAPLDTNMSDEAWRALTEADRRSKSEYYRLYRENRDLLIAWVGIGRTNLFNKLGIKEVNGALRFSDPNIVSDFLRTNMKGNKSENLKQLLKVQDGAFYLPLDATPSSQKIQNILFSFIDNTVIRPKLFGGSKPQVASTFFEERSRSYVYISDKTGKYEVAEDLETMSQTEKSSMRLTSNDLQFYKDKKGKVTGIEVYLPWYFKGKIDLSKVDNSLLSGIGFRIPTQSLASVENIIIKGFLPKSMGDSIVVPSEITGKAGSDFDIDKLNLYLFEMTMANGKYTRIPFLDESNSTLEQRYITYVMDIAEREDIAYIDKISSGEFGRIQGEFSNQLTKIKARLGSLKKQALQEEFELYRNQREALQELLDSEKKDYVDELFIVGQELFRNLSQDLKQLFWDNRARNQALGLKGAADIASHRALALDIISMNHYEGEEERQILTDMIDIYDQEIQVFTSGKTKFDAFYSKNLEEAKARFQERKAFTKDLFKYEEAKQRDLLKDIYANPRLELEFYHAQEVAKLSGAPSFSEFTGFPLLQQNTEKALKNKYIENLQQLISLPENKRNLLSPNSARTLQRLADEVEAAENGITITELKKRKKAELANHSRLLNPNYMARIRQAFLVGKAGVGITAVNATNHILNTIAGSYIRRDSSQIKFPFNTKVVVQTINGKKIERVFPSLAFAKDKDGNWISDNISEFLNAYVDVAKDPFIITLNAGIDNASTFLFMNKIGIPLDDIAWFMNQPILKEYTKLTDMVKSYHTETNPAFNQEEYERDGKKRIRKITPAQKRNSEIARTFKLKEIKKEAPRTKKYSVAELKKAITDWHKYQSGKIKELPMSFYELQSDVYNDYWLFKSKMSQDMTNVISVTPYDTKQFNSLGKARVMDERYTSLEFTTKYGGLDNYMNSLHLNAIKDLYPEFLQAFSNLFFTEHPKTRAILDRAMKPIVNTTRGEKTFELADFLAKEFITYILTTTEQVFDGRRGALSDFITPLFLGEKNMATRLVDIIRRIKAGEIDASRAVEELSPVIRNNVEDTRNIKMWSSKFTTPELNQIYYEFMAMADSADPEVRRFKDNLTSFILLQSGMNNSPLNFSRFLPIEDFGRIAKPIFARFESISERDLESFLQQVIANNPKIFGIPLKDKRSIVGSEGLVNFDSSNPELAGTRFILQPINEDRPVFNRSSVYTINSMNPDISREDRKKMVEANDWSFLQQSIFMEVVDSEGNSMIYFDDQDKMYYIYREIPPLGDSIYLKEYYRSDRQSVVKKNNRFKTIEEDGVTREELIRYPTNEEMIKYLSERQADSAAKNQPIPESKMTTQDEQAEEDILALPTAANVFEEAEYEDVTEDPKIGDTDTDETEKQEDFNPDELKPCD